MAERFGADRNVVYGLLACGVASCLAMRWEEADVFLERARERITATSAGGEWIILIDGFSALCHAEMGHDELALARTLGAVQKAMNDSLDIQNTVQGCLRARVLRTIGGIAEQDALEAQIAETLEVIERTSMNGWLPLLLLERAGLARLRGRAEDMASDLAEARRLFAEMGVTGWDDYARSIEK